MAKRTCKPLNNTQRDLYQKTKPKCAAAGISASTLWHRIHDGWEEDELLLPLNSLRKSRTIKKSAKKAAGPTTIAPTWAVPKPGVAS